VEHFGFPDHFNSLVLGYFGIDVFEAVLNRVPNIKALAFAKHEAKPPTPPPVQPDEDEPNLPL
jgi:hypothetical protein